MWSFPNNNNIEDMPESFTMLTGKFSGLPFIASINMSAKNYKNKKSFPWFLGISVSIKKPDKNGFPGKDELAEINKFEDRPQAIISKNLQYRFIGWSNWNSHREILYYTTEPKLVAEELQKIVDSNKEIPFAYRTEHDEKWKNISVYF